MRGKRWVVVAVVVVVVEYLWQFIDLSITQKPPKAASTAMTRFAHFERLRHPSSGSRLLFLFLFFFSFFSLFYFSPFLLFSFSLFLFFSFSLSPPSSSPSSFSDLLHSSKVMRVLVYRCTITMTTFHSILTIWWSSSYHYFQITLFPTSPPPPLSYLVRPLFHSDSVLNRFIWV